MAARRLLVGTCRGRPSAETVVHPRLSTLVTSAEPGDHAAAVALFAALYDAPVWSPPAGSTRWCRPPSDASLPGQPPWMIDLHRHSLHFGHDFLLFTPRSRGQAHELFTCARRSTVEPGATHRMTRHHAPGETIGLLSPRASSFASWPSPWSAPSWLLLLLPGSGARCWSRHPTIVWDPARPQCSHLRRHLRRRVGHQRTPLGCWYPLGIRPQWARAVSPARRCGTRRARGALGAARSPVLGVLPAREGAPARLLRNNVLPVGGQVVMMR
jgi:hypothetical protein